MCTGTQVHTVLGASGNSAQKWGPGEPVSRVMTHSRQFPAVPVSWAAVLGNLPATHRSDRHQSLLGSSLRSLLQLNRPQSCLGGTQVSPSPWEIPWMKNTTLTLSMWVSVFWGTSLSAG